MSRLKDRNTRRGGLLALGALLLAISVLAVPAGAAAHARGEPYPASSRQSTATPSAPAPTAAPTRVWTATPAATATPQLSYFPPGAIQLPDWLNGPVVLVLGGAGVVLLGGLLILALVLWLWRMRTRRPAPARPASPPSGAPPPAPAGLQVTAPMVAAEPAAMPAGSHPYLEFEGLPGGPRRFAMDRELLTIGRATNCELRITETFPSWETVSRRHARIVRESRHGQVRMIIEDLGSRNGVAVNGRRTGRNVLRDGWRVSLGRLTFTYRSNDASPQGEVNDGSLAP